jgi:hypothetical protein
MGYPLEVYWHYGAHDYAMQKIRHSEMLFLQKASPGCVGIPTVWSVDENGDPCWFPETINGYLIVRAVA